MTDPLARQACDVGNRTTSSARVGRIGLLGAGRFARLVHIPALRRMRGVELVAVADPAPVAKTQVLMRWPDLCVYASAEELLALGELDAVIVATPPATHVDIAVRALDRDLHVYVEKPISHDVDEAGRLVSAWQDTDRVGAVGLNQRRSALTEQARRLVSEGAIGEPVAYRGLLCSAPRELPTWKLRRETGGGVLLDLLTHHVDLAPFLLGSPVVQVACSVRSLRSPGDTASATLRLERGVEAQITTSMAGPEVDRFEVVGDDGILIADRYRGWIQLQPPRRSTSRSARARDALREVLQTPRRALRSALPQPDDSHERALSAFVHVALGGGEFRPNLLDGLQNLLVLTAAERSVDENGAFQAVRRVEGAATSAGETGHAGRVPVDIKLGDCEPTERGGHAQAADLSVVLVASEGFRSVERVVRHLRNQTIADQIELVLVTPSNSLVADRSPTDLDGFRSVTIVESGPIENVDKAAALGMRASSAGIVASVEDHAYPTPGWAHAIVEAHRGPWAVVGSAIRNANPASSLSWTNQLLAYGTWSEPVRTGTTDHVSRSNLSYKREALSAYGERLGDRMGRDGDLLRDLARRGQKFFLAGDAVVEHANPSRLGSTVRLRLGAGRLAAATRASAEQWSPVRRAAYVLASPLFPALRFRHLAKKVFSPTLRRLLVPRALPALAFGLVLDAIGQAIGFAVGPGRTAEVLATFEVNRNRHMTIEDQRLFST